MSQELQNSIKGLQTAANKLSSIEKGSLKKAENVVLDNDGLLESRKGFSALDATLDNSNDRFKKVFEYQGKLFGLDTTNKLRYYDSSSWNSSNTLETSFLDHVITSKNLYLLSNTGTKKLDVYNSSITGSGVPKALDISGSLTGSSGFLANNKKVAYRLLWFFKDLNNNLVLGAVSHRIEISNASGGTRDVDVSVNIPNDITVNYGYQLYRSSQEDTAVTPDDELQLVFEGNPTSGEISAGTLTISDIVPDELAGAFIYTSNSQETLAYNNEIIPKAETMASYNNTLFLGNTTSPNRSFVTMLAIGSPNGVQIDDTITIDGDIYTAKVSSDYASREFQLVTSGSASQNIQDTALDLVACVNDYSSDYNAFYLSGPDDLPGLILIEENGVGGSSFTTAVSRSTAWNIKNPTSTNDNFTNQVVFSKTSQPEHFPLPNSFFVGNGDILKLVPLKEALLCFTTEGVYRITGFNPSFSVELIDSSAILIGNTARVLNNEVFCLTTQGVSKVNGNSVKIISRDIEDSILGLIRSARTSVESLAYGLGSEEERRFYLHLPANASSSTNEQVFVYHLFTSSWTKWTIKSDCGVIFDNTLHLGHSESNKLLVQKTDYSTSDYSDSWNGYTTTIDTIDGTTFVISTNTTNIDVGDLLTQGTKTAIVTAKDNETFTVSYNSGFNTVDSVSIDKAIPIEVTFNPIFEENPGIFKRYIDGMLFFQSGLSGSAVINLSTDISPNGIDISLSNNSTYSWESFTWEEGYWEGIETSNERFWIRGLRGSQLNFKFIQNYAQSPFKLQGFSVYGRTVKTSRMRR